MRDLELFSDYIAQKYGKKLYRIPLDLALGCPNRLDRFGAGCIFCAENGSRAQHLSRGLDLKKQVVAGIKFARERYGATAPYIAYFQSFTNTFAPVEKLRELYSEALAAAEFRVVIIATRSDALPDDVVDFLAELSQEYELWVELGVQSANDSTLDTINRGHTFEQTVTAVEKLHARGINTACHLILGLPGEGEAEMLATAAQIARLPFEAIKIHQLLVLKNTELARCFYADAAIVTPLDEYSYAAILAKILRELPDGMKVMRLNADAAKEEIITPRWWMNKSQFLDFFRREFESPSLFPAQKTADGSLTLYHPIYKQHFHTLAGANAEAEHKFIMPTDIAAKLATGAHVRVLDVGFGLGGNAFATLKSARDNGGKVEITALEYDLRILPAIRKFLPGESAEVAILKALEENLFYSAAEGSITLIEGDARRTLSALPPDLHFDYIHLDGFSPDRNPELWSFDFIRLLLKRLTPDGMLVTYSASNAVRGALLRAGACIGETEPFGRRRSGTIGTMNAARISCPLSDKEFGIIRHSTAGLALRDPSLSDSATLIIERRAKTVKRLRDRGVPKWYNQFTKK